MRDTQLVFSRGRGPHPKLVSLTHVTVAPSSLFSCTRGEFDNDMELLFTNAETYNREDSMVFHYAKQMKAVFEDATAELPFTLESESAAMLLLWCCVASSV